MALPTLAQAANCSFAVTTVEQRIWLAPLDAWEAYKVAESFTVTNSLASAFPAADAPFLSSFSIGAKGSFEPIITNVKVSGQVVFQHGLKLTCYEKTGAKVDAYLKAAKCGRFVAIMENVPVGGTGEGRYVIIGDAVGIELVADGDYTHNFATEGGALMLTLKSDVDAGRYEPNAEIVLHVAAGTAAAIAAHTIV
jgi:hypothetical protein